MAHGRAACARPMPSPATWPDSPRPRRWGSARSLRADEFPRGRAATVLEHNPGGAMGCALRSSNSSTPHPAWETAPAQGVVMRRRYACSRLRSLAAVPLVTLLANNIADVRRAFAIRPLVATIFLSALVIVACRALLRDMSEAWWWLRSCCSFFPSARLGRPCGFPCRNLSPTRRRRQRRSSWGGDFLRALSSSAGLRHPGRANSVRRRCAHAASPRVDDRPP